MEKTFVINLNLGNHREQLKKMAKGKEGARNGFTGGGYTSGGCC